MELRQLQHLFARAGFGLGYRDLKAMSGMPADEVVRRLFRESETSSPLEIDLSEFEPVMDLTYRELADRYTESEVRDFRSQSRLRVKELNVAWLERMANTDEVLREKMTLFWANHFVCRDNTVWHIQQYNNTLRDHALGNFGDFVKAVAREPSMSKYLNNKENSAESPNENFARELMELFMLGIGNYTENDIKEAARAFTGWSFHNDGSFLFRKGRHDFGRKTFFGETGNFDGDDIIDIILEQKQCARFICSKIYRYFVNPVQDAGRIEELTDIFFDGYDIERLMLHIFRADWFYDKRNIGVKIKSPVELLVGIQHVVPVRFDEQKQLLYLQRMMGQVLLDPPNVAGWKGDRAWIDPNSLMFRMKLPSLLLSQGVIDLEEKGDFKDPYETFYRGRQPGGRSLKTTVDWDEFERGYGTLTREDLQKVLIIPDPEEAAADFLSGLATDDPKEQCVQLMSLPEYQLC